MPTARLKKLAGLILPHQNVADIGTDHAHLPIQLANKGHTGVLIAADIADGPLNKAKTNVKRSKLEDRIQLRKGDGLDPIVPGEVDVAVIAGMGGTLICDILQAGESVARQCQALLLQPMTNVHLLREFLAKNKYLIEDEVLVKEGFRLYSILKVRSGAESITDPLYYYVSKPLIQNGGEPLTEYVSRIRREFEKIAKSLVKSCEQQERIAWYLSMAEKLKTLEGNEPKDEM